MGDISYIRELIMMEKGKPTLLTPYLISKDENKTLAHVYLGTAQEGLATTAYTKVLLATKVRDVGSNFASYKYTASVTGDYHVDWSTYLANNGGTLSYGLSHLYRNGSSIRVGNFGAPVGGEFISHGSSIVYMTAGQYLELYAYGVTASSTWKIKNSSTATFMSVYLISRY